MKGNDQLIRMDEQPYDSEDLLQELLEKYPSLLAGDQMDSGRPRRWLLVKREAELASEEDGANRWSVDHLFLDQDGIPTIVEVKRSSDTRIRREVVGQMLDYAANAVVYWPIEKIRAMFESHCEQAGKNHEQMLMDFLAGDGDAENFWLQVKTNFEAGRIRLLFVADEIPNELRRIVEFLNEQMKSAEVLAVEIKQFIGQGLKTLVPRVIGQTAEAERAKSAGGRREFRDWDEAAFFDALQQNVDANLVAAARKLAAWGKAKASGIRFGSGAKIGALMPYLEHNGADAQCFKIRSDGEMQISFTFHKHLAAFANEEMRELMREKINQIPSIQIGREYLDAHPKFDLKLLADEKALQQFIAAFDWFVEQAKAV